jgi:hypothetical protein
MSGDTAFRRDYEDPSYFYYNVDAEESIAFENPPSGAEKHGLSYSELCELIVFRRFVLPDARTSLRLELNVRLTKF